MFDALRYWKYSFDVKRLVGQAAEDYDDLIQESFAAGLSAPQCAERISLEDKEETGEAEVDEENVSEEALPRNEDITEP